MAKPGPSEHRAAGRRPGKPDTRAAILEAARADFAAKGFDKTTIRGVARQADVDPALVHHYFGDKVRLLMAALQLPLDPRPLIGEILKGDPLGMGERLVHAFVSTWDADPRPLVAVLKAAVANDSLRDLVREGLMAGILEHVAGYLAVPQARLRAELVASQLIGLAVVRYVLRIEPFASTSVENVTSMVGPRIQDYLSGAADNRVDDGQTHPE